MSRTVASPAPVDPAVYAQALADVVALRPYGTYRAKPEPLPPTDDPRCGTRTGYKRHRRLGERSCKPCSAANSGADRRLRETGTSVVAAR
jgi:hypothetical protein